MRVLVPVDGSKSSLEAVNAARELAKTKGAGICLMTVVPPIADFDYELSASQREAVKRSLMLHAEEVIEEAKEVFTGNGIIPRCVVKTDSNSIASEICNFAEREQIDLVIIGRKGLTRLNRAVMGSVTARVIGCSPVDILVVPSDSVVKWNKILLATDGSKCSEAAKDTALEIASGHRSELKVVSVVDVPDEAYAEAPNAIEKLGERARAIGEAVRARSEEYHIDADVFVREGEAHKVIVDIAKKENVDLICMGSHGRTGIGRFIMGSVTEKVISSAACPVLIVKSCEAAKR